VNLVAEHIPEASKEEMVQGELFQYKQGGIFLFRGT
jgi:hypothetical protein